MINSEDLKSSKKGSLRDEKSLFLQMKNLLITKCLTVALWSKFKKTLKILSNTQITLLNMLFMLINQNFYSNNLYSNLRTFRNFQEYFKNIPLTTLQTNFQLKILSLLNPLLSKKTMSHLYSHNLKLQEKHFSTPHDHRQK